MSVCTLWRGIVLCMTLLVGVATVAAEPDQRGDQPNKKQQRENADAKGDKQARRDKGDGGDVGQKRESREKRRAERRERFFQALFKDIELSEEQTSQARDIMIQAHKQQKAWRDEHKDELREIRSALGEARRNDDKEAGKAAHEKLRALMKDAPVRDGIPDTLRKMFSEEQLEQIQKNMKEIRERRHKRHQERKARENQEDGKKTDAADGNDAKKKDAGRDGDKPKREKRNAPNTDQ